MTALLFLAGAALLGVRIVHLTLGRLLNRVEQSLFGLVAGWMAAIVCAYGVAYSMGRLSFWPMFVLSLCLIVIAGALWFPVLRRLWRRGERPALWWRSEYASVIVLLLLFAPLFYYMFSIRMFHPQPDGLYSGGNSWNDMSLHLAISTSFLHGENFPPGYTPYAGEPLRYPFMPDFQTAVLMALGLNPYGALMITAVPLALTITGLFYCLALRIVRSQAAAFLAALLFLLNGGLGFFYFLDDWRKSKESFATFWGHMERNYANMWDQQLHWANIIVDCFLPQRTSLYGIPIALIAFTIFAIVWRHWHSGEMIGRWDGWRPLLSAGVLVGLLPLFHAHTYVAVGLVSVFLFLIKPRWEWLAFWTPAVAVAALQIINQTLSLTEQVSSGELFHWQPGWKGRDEASWTLYWIRNIGLPLLLIIPAWFAAPARWRWFYTAFFCLFAFCFFVRITSHDYDNIKLMYYWYGISCIFVASWIVNLARRHRQYFLAALLVLVSIASGILALQRERLIHWRSFTSEEMDAAMFAVNYTPPKAIFLTAPIHNQPILCLAGRPILLGYGGWLWTHGYQFQQREGDIKKIFAGDAQAKELLRHYGVSYIYLSRSERDILKANEDYLNENFPIVFQKGETTIYAAQSESTRSVSD